MPDPTVCNNCGSTESTPRFAGTAGAQAGPRDATAFRCTHSGYGKHYPIVECVRCGFVYATLPFDPASVLTAYTTVEDPDYLAEREGRRLTFERQLKSIERYRPRPARLLDVGAYTGVFVDVARKGGWEASGIEPSVWAVEEARKLGLPVINGTLQSPELRPGSFDVITLLDVIEHFSDPARELRRVRELLANRGLIVVHTMDIGSLTAKMMGRRWPWLMEMHLFYFSQTTLADMLRRSGFRVIDSRVQGRYLRSSYLATRVGGLLGVGPGRILGRILAALGLGNLVVPVNFGDLFTAYAEKEGE